MIVNSTKYVWGWAGAALALVLGLVLGCDSRMNDAPAAEPESEPGLLEQHNHEEPAAQNEDEPTASADIEAAEGSEIEGEAKFYADAAAVRVVIDVKGALPGKKGVHIHEKGDCSNIAGKSMGDHFAPEGDKHGLPAEQAAGIGHLGDLGNIQIGPDGKGHLEATVSGATLTDGNRMSFVGKALVIHSGEDSGKAKQPAGDSGTPMGCGVIKKS